MSTLADALHEFTQASNGLAAAEHVQTLGAFAYTDEPLPVIMNRAERRLARAGDAFETELVAMIRRIAVEER